MTGLSRTTKSLSKAEALASRGWVLIDAQDRVVGRLACEIASLLRGKTKPSFTPNVDAGDFVVVVNAGKMRFTGGKELKKSYYRHSGYPGAIREVSAGDMLAKHPDRVLKMAVAGMLPKNRLAKKLVTKLKVYAGAEHPHRAQKPQPRA